MTEDKLNISSIQVETSTWKEVEQSLNHGLICIVPIGASCKAHGLHLPLNTDFVQAQWISQHLAEHFPVIVWPVVNSGYYPAFVDYPGSWTISEVTFINYMLDIIQSIAKHGENKIVLLNTGISTISPLETVCKQTPFRSRTTLLNVYAGKSFKKAKKTIQEQQQGGHADEIETSIMLAIDDAQVRMKHAKRGLEDIHRGPLNLNSPNKPNYCPTGSMGDPSLATTEKGEKVLAALIKDLSEKLSSLI